MMNLVTSLKKSLAYYKPTVAASLFAVLITAPLMSTANTEIDLEWPCIQGYVPEVGVAVVWPEPIEEDMLGSWLKDKELKKVVNDFGALETFDDVARARLETFAESVLQENRIDVYSQVADGIVYRFNQRRTEYLKGIRKFTKQQIAISEKVQSHLNELVELENKTDADSVTRTAELRETTAWQQRIFDRREGAIRSLCETPVELESLMGEILRDLAQYLP